MPCRLTVDVAVCADTLNAAAPAPLRPFAGLRLVEDTKLAGRQI